MTSIFYRFRFLGKKWDEKNFESFFVSLVAHIFQYWRKIQKPFFLKTNSKDGGGLFVPNKLSSSSMTPSFFCWKNLLFSEKIFLLLHLSLYISGPRTKTESMVSHSGQRISRLSLKVKTTSIFFRSGIIWQINGWRKGSKYFHFFPNL